MQHHHSVDASGVFSGPVGADLRAKLASDENVLAALQVDLSADLRFVSGWVVVTSRRLLACDPGATVWRDWPLAPGLALKLQDHGGVGTLELHNPQERVAFWRFTLGHHPQALRLVQREAPDRIAGVAQTLYAALASGTLVGLAMLLAGQLYDTVGALGYLAMTVIAAAGLAMIAPAIPLSGAKRVPRPTL